MEEFNVHERYDLKIYTTVNNTCISNEHFSTYVITTIKSINRTTTMPLNPGIVTDLRNCQFYKFYVYHMYGPIITNILLLNYTKLVDFIRPTCTAELFYDGTNLTACFKIDNKLCNPVNISIIYKTLANEATFDYAHTTLACIPNLVCCDFEFIVNVTSNNNVTSYHFDRNYKYLYTPIYNISKVFMNKTKLILNISIHNIFCICFLNDSYRYQLTYSKNNRMIKKNLSSTGEILNDLVPCHPYYFEVTICNYLFTCSHPVSKEVLYENDPPVPEGLTEYISDRIVLFQIDNFPRCGLNRNRFRGIITIIKPDNSIVKLNCTSEFCSYTQFKACNNYTILVQICNSQICSGNYTKIYRQGYKLEDPKILHDYKLRKEIPNYFLKILLENHTYCFKNFVHVSKMIPGQTSNYKFNSTEFVLKNLSICWQTSITIQEEKDTKFTQTINYISSVNISHPGRLNISSVNGVPFNQTHMNVSVKMVKELYPCHTLNVFRYNICVIHKNKTVFTSLFYKSIEIVPNLESCKKYLINVAVCGSNCSIPIQHIFYKIIRPQPTKISSEIIETGIKVFLSLIPNCNLYYYKVLLESVSNRLNKSIETTNSTLYFNSLMHCQFYSIYAATCIKNQSCSNFTKERIFYSQPVKNPLIDKFKIIDKGYGIFYKVIISLKKQYICERFFILIYLFSGNRRSFNISNNFTFEISQLNVCKVTTASISIKVGNLTTERLSLNLSNEGFSAIPLQNVSFTNFSSTHVRLKIFMKDKLRSCGVYVDFLFKVIISNKKLGVLVSKTSNASIIYIDIPTCIVFFMEVFTCSRALCYTSSKLRKEFMYPILPPIIKRHEIISDDGISLLVQFQVNDKNSYCSTQQPKVYKWVFNKTRIENLRGTLMTYSIFIDKIQYCVYYRLKIRTEINGTLSNYSEYYFRHKKEYFQIQLINTSFTLHRSHFYDLKIYWNRVHLCSAETYFIKGTDNFNYVNRDSETRNFYIFRNVPKCSILNISIRWYKDNITSKPYTFVHTLLKKRPLTMERKYVGNEVVLNWTLQGFELCKASLYHLHVYDANLDTILSIEIPNSSFLVVFQQCFNYIIKIIYKIPNSNISYVLAENSTTDDSFDLGQVFIDKLLILSQNESGFMSASVKWNNQLSTTASWCPPLYLSLNVTYFQIYFEKTLISTRLNLTETYFKFTNIRTCKVYNVKISICSNISCSKPSVLTKLFLRATLTVTLQPIENGLSSKRVVVVSAFIPIFCKTVFFELKIYNLINSESIQHIFEPSNFWFDLDNLTLNYMYYAEARQIISVDNKLFKSKYSKKQYFYTGGMAPSNRLEIGPVAISQFTCNFKFSFDSKYIGAIFMVILRIMYDTECVGFHKCICHNCVQTNYLNVMNPKNRRKFETYKICNEKGSFSIYGYKDSYFDINITSMIQISEKFQFQVILVTLGNVSLASNKTIEGISQVTIYEKYSIWKIVLNCFLILFLVLLALFLCFCLFLRCGFVSVRRFERSFKRFSVTMALYNFISKIEPYSENIERHKRISRYNRNVDHIIFVDDVTEEIPENFKEITKENVKEKDNEQKNKLTPVFYMIKKKVNKLNEINTKEDKDGDIKKDNKEKEPSFSFDDTVEKKEEKNKSPNIRKSPEEKIIKIL